MTWALVEREVTPTPRPGKPLAEHRDPGLQQVFLLRFRPHCPVP